MTDVAGVIEPVQLDFLWRPQLRDADDEMVVKTAANAGANYLVTHTLSEFRAIAGRFTFEVVTPGEFLQRYK